MRTAICKLSKDRAIDAIKSESKVMFKSGVWNSYEEKPVPYVNERIRNSGYGADVDYDEATGKYYVCCPCHSDMW